MACSTVIGSGDFGIDNDEDGLIINNLSFSYTQDDSELRNREGCVVGRAMYNQRVEISMDASLPATGAFSTKLAGSLSLNNSIPERLQDSLSSGTLIVEGIDETHASEDFKTISVNATLYPYVS